MSNFLGYALFSDLNAFYAWQGTDDDPAIGTVNATLGFNSLQDVKRYTTPIDHPNSDYGHDPVTNIPFYEPVGYWASLGRTFTNPDERIICIIKDDCPSDLIPTTLYTLADVQAMGFLPIPAGITP